MSEPEAPDAASLAWYFAGLSLLAIGGANAVIPEIQRHAVVTAHWVTEREFNEFFAISQAAPGPNLLIVTLIGWRVAGLAGALAATAAMCLPTSLLTYAVAGVWHRFREAPWRIAVQTGLTSVTIGLVGASAFVLARSMDRTTATTLITVGTALFCSLTKLNPLWAFGAAALLGLAGLC